MVQKMAEVEKEKILEAVLETGSIPRAAVALGIARATMYRKIRAYGLTIRLCDIIRAARTQQLLQLSQK